MTASTRRAALGAILAAPLASVSAVAAPSVIVGLCDRAVAHMDWINDTSHPVEDWPDERTDAEVARFDAMLAEVANRPSASLADIKAKARLVIADQGSDLRNSEADHDRLLYGLLREVIALCA